MMNHSLLLDRLQDGLSLLEGQERAMATESLSIAHLHFGTVNTQNDQLKTPASTLSQEPISALARKKLLVRLGQLSELLGRRRAQAMPFAALSRALIAELHNDERASSALLTEADIKLTMFGL